MLPRSDKPAVEVVQIDSSDEEDSVVVVTATNSKSSTTQPTSSSFRPPLQKLPEKSPQATAVPPVVGDSHSLECRSFWKAGVYDVNLVSSKAPPQGKLEHARVHPKFLHSNATSHKWAFGAIAELLDNAVDEIHNGATFVKVDKIDVMKDNSPALVFQDDGSGMNPESIRKCMSLGYSSKKSNTTIGQYGNGFKTSTMRLGSDVIVFSRATRASKATQSVGLLSYSFLMKTGQDDVIVPMVDFDISRHWAEPIIYSSQDDWSSNLNMILEWSPFTSRDELMEQFEMIGQLGTRIIIYNLWLNDEGIYELSFDDDDEDICLRDEANRDQPKLDKRKHQKQSHISYCLRYSLRAYASILYLRKFKNFTIILRGKQVHQLNVADDLRYSEKVAYRPQLASTSKEIVVETTIGFIKEAPALAVCGFNVYHKNRLVRPFWKVIGEGSVKGNGVVGVLEANFLEPAHDKQDFERSSLFIRLETRLKQMVSDYWKTHCHFVGYQPPNFRSQNMQKGPVAKTDNLPLPIQRNIGVPVNLLDEGNLDQQVSGLPANSHQEMSERRLGRNDQISSPAEQHVAGFTAASYVSTDVTFEGGSGPIWVNQLCEENIQLYMRFEEQMQKEAELEQTVGKLEKELEQAKRKCDQLSAHLEIKRREMIVKQGGKVS